MVFKTSKYPQDYISENPYLAGLVTGVVTGIAIGLLIAPRSEKKLRKTLEGKVSDKKDKLKHHWDKTQEKAGEVLDNAKTQADKLAHKAQDKIDDYTDTVEKKAEQIADETKSGFDKLKDVFR